MDAAPGFAGFLGLEVVRPEPSGELGNGDLFHGEDRVPAGADPGPAGRDDREIRERCQHVVGGPGVVRIKELKWGGVVLDQHHPLVHDRRECGAATRNLEVTGPRVWTAELPP